MKLVALALALLLAACGGGPVEDLLDRCRKDLRESGEENRDTECVSCADRGPSDFVKQCLSDVGSDLQE
jgi:hypothetical protein